MSTLLSACGGGLNWYCVRVLVGDSLVFKVFYFLSVSFCQFDGGKQAQHLAIVRTKEADELVFIAASGYVCCVCCVGLVVSILNLCFFFF